MSDSNQNVEEVAGDAPVAGEGGIPSYTKEQKVEISAQWVKDTFINAGYMKKSDVEGADPTVVEEEVYLMQPPQQNPQDGSIFMACEADPESEMVYVHTVLSSVMTREEFIKVMTQEQSDIVSDENSGQIVGLDGEAISSEAKPEIIS